MKHSDHSPVGYYTIAVAALFLAGFLLLVVFGAHSFRNTAAGQNDNMETRAVLSYLNACLRANDTAGAVSVRDGGESPVLTVADGDTGYGLRIYCRGGSLLEDYARLEDELRPEDAMVIGPAETFAVHWPAEDLLAVETDAGRVLVRLRSGGGE